MIKLSEIVYESDCGKYWVKAADFGFEVYITGITHSTRCAIIGYKGALGLERAKAEIDRRLARK
jgi:hypothetical protein